MKNEMGCKSNIVAIANKEQKNWGFSWLVRKKKNQKSEKFVSKEGTVCSLGKNPLTSKVKVRFEPGSKNGSTTLRRQKLDFLLGLGVLIVEMRWRGTWSPTVDLLWRRWRWGLQHGFGFLLSGKRRDKEGREELGIYGCSLSWLKKYYFSMLVSFFYHSNTHTKHIFYIFWILKNVV